MYFLLEIKPRGPVHPANGVKQPVAIAQPFADSSAEGADSLQIGEIGFNRCRQPGRRFGHHLLWLLRCSELLKSLNPRLKVGTFGADVLQANPFGHL